MRPWRCLAAVALASTACLADSGRACEPQRPYDPILSKATRDDFAKRLIQGSTVIADGVIVWTKKGWRAQSSGRALAGLPLIDSLPWLKPTKIYKGRYQPRYMLIDDTDQCGNVTFVMGLRPGTKVRLLLSPVKTRQGTLIWIVKDTSWSGTRKHEIQINAAIDRLLAAKRSPDNASLLYPLPRVPR